MDPVTIATTVFSIAKACAMVAGELRQFIDGTKLAGLTINVLVENVQGFQDSLEQLDGLLKDPRFKTCLDKATSTINSLQGTIADVSKDASVFVSVRKHIRLKNAANKIDLYQQLIRSYKDTVTISLQTLMIWNQVSAKESSAEVTPKLYETQAMIRRFGRDINRRMAVVTGLLSSPAEHDSDEQMLREQRIGLTTFGNFNTHLSFAADMVSSASTAMGVSNASDDHGSDFGDNFPQLPKDQTLHWIESNGIAEAESTTGQLPPDLAPDRAASEWDSDDDMELELARESIRLGDSKLNTEDYKEAEGHFKFSIERVNTSASTAAVMFKEKVVALSGLAQSYFMQAKYDDAEKGLRELIEIDCREENYSDPNDSSLRLAKVLMRKGNFTEASLYARKACKAYKKMGPAMLDRYELSLTLLIEICKASGKKTDEDVYTSLLSNLKLSSPERWEGSMEVRENHGFMQVPIIEAQGLGSERSLPAGNDLQDVKVARADRTLLKKTISQENLLREERMREERTRMRELEERMRENSMRKEGMWEKIMRKVKEEMMLDAGP